MGLDRQRQNENTTKSSFQNSRFLEYSAYLVMTCLYLQFIEAR